MHNTHTFSLSISPLSLCLSHTHTHIKPFIDSLTTLFHPSIFHQRVKDGWRKGGIEVEMKGKDRENSLENMQQKITERTMLL